MAHKQLNQLKYAALLVETLPRLIESEAANERALKVVARRLAKPKFSVLVAHRMLHAKGDSSYGS